MSQSNADILMPKERIQLLMEHLFSKLNIEDSHFTIAPGCNAGDNWLGLIHSVQAEGKERKGSRIHLDLIAKLAPHQEAYRSLFVIRKMFEREIYIYDNVLPEFIKLQQEKNIKEIFQPFAKRHLTSTDDLQEAIVLEDMRKKGYSLQNYRAVVDYQHARLVMQQMGKLHALSFAMRDQKPGEFDELRTNCAESFINTTFFDPLIKLLLCLGNQTLQSYDSGEERKLFEKFIQNLPSVLQNILQAEKYGQFAVINHGDVQIRNLLFKREANSRTEIPKELCFIDWQLARYASPVFDISLFIFICTDKGFRERHYKNLIEEYYQELAAFLRELGSDPEILFPFNILQEHLKKFSVYGFYLAFWGIASIIKKTEDILDVYSTVDADAIVNDIANIRNPMYFTRIKDIVVDFINYGYEFY